MNVIKQNDVKFYKTRFFLIETSHYFGDVFVLIINDLNEVLAAEWIYTKINIEYPLPDCKIGITVGMPSIL